MADTVAASLGSEILAAFVLRNGMPVPTMSSARNTA
jgi:hypothetical protein